MPAPTEDEIMAALQDAAEELPGGRWRFRGGVTHSLEEARDITEACLRLDVVVTDILTSAAWVTLVRRVVALEDRLAESPSGRSA